MSYSQKVIDHYENPRNVGNFDKGDDTVGTGMVGAPACGDVMKLQIKVNPATGLIEDARFKTYGCGSAIASSSLVTEWVKGKTLDQALTIKNTQIAEELVAMARYPAVICDRSVLDNYVYLLLSAGRQEGLDALVETWIRSYTLLVHVPVIETPSPDGIRSANPAFQLAVEERLMRELADRGIEALRLDPGQRAAWLDAVEHEVWERVLGPVQLPLL